MEITLADQCDEKPRNVMETLEFFVKNDKNYTTTELKEADILHSAKNLVGKGFLDCKETYLTIKENALRERINIYSLNDAGREYYKKETKNK